MIPNPVESHARRGRGWGPWRSAVQALPALAAAILFHPAAAAQLTDETGQFAGVERHFIVARPDAGSPGARPDAPGHGALVLLFHGHLGSAREVFGRSPLAAWLAISDRDGVTVAALDGLSGSDRHSGWNDCRSDADTNPKADDVAFSAGVVGRLMASDGLDPRRVYVMGMSNGGVFTYRLATEMKPPVAGFAAVSALMPAQSACGAPDHPVPALIIMGESDPILPFAGGPVRLFGSSKRGSVQSFDDTVRLWRAVNHCLREPVVDTFPHQTRSGATVATRAVYAPDAGGAPLETIRIAGGGHAEPTLGPGYGILYRSFAGAQNHDFESAEEAWRFFQEARTPASTAAR